MYMQKRNTKHICIIGGSGFVGHVIADAAHQQGYRITIACRYPEKARGIQGKTCLGLFINAAT